MLQWFNEVPTYLPTYLRTYLGWSYSRTEDEFEKRMTKMSERGAAEMPVQPQVKELKDLKFVSAECKEVHV